MSEFLKGNFKVKKEVVEKEENTKEQSIREKLKKEALNSIGGSMVYVERTDLTWDPETEETENKENS